MLCVRTFRVHKPRLSGHLEMDEAASGSDKTTRLAERRPSTCNNWPIWVESKPTPWRYVIAEAQIQRALVGGFESSQVAAVADRGVRVMHACLQTTAGPKAAVMAVALSLKLRQHALMPIWPKRRKEICCRSGLRSRAG